MNPKTRLLLTFAAGLALGLTAGATCDRPANSGPSPVVTARSGHLTGTDPPKELRPLTLRVGDDLHQLRDAGPSPVRAVIYLDVSGVPVVASFEVAD